SVPTRVASTPGWAAARETSTFRMRACGCGERRRRAKAMRGRTRTAPNTVCPVTFAAASTLTSGCPMTVRSFRSCSGTRGPHPLGGHLDRLEDLRVPGAPARVPRRRFRDLLARGRRLLLEQGGRGQQEPRSAVAALRGPEGGEGLLKRMQGRPRHPFHGRDVPIPTLNGQGEAGQDRTS